MSETKVKSKDDDKFKEWYEDNATEWNKKRRSRYSDDAEYRALVLERNRKSRAIARKERLTERKAESAKKSERVSARWKEVVVTIGGKDVTLYSVGFIARRLGVSVQAIRLWERNGDIPPPSNGSNRDGKDRLYSPEDVENIRNILTQTGRIEERNESAGSVVRVRPPVAPQEREVAYKGGKTKVEKLFTVGAMAEAVGRTVVTLEGLERRGDLPETPLRSSSVGRRLYTVAMINVVEKAFASRPGLIRGRVAWDSFKAEVLAGWQKIGAMNAKLVAKPDEK